MNWLWKTGRGLKSPHVWTKGTAIYRGLSAILRVNGLLDPGAFDVPDSSALLSEIKRGLAAGS
jgi:hypothetical protein